jgi:hypothetical protein
MELGTGEIIPRAQTLSPALGGPEGDHCDAFPLGRDERLMDVKSWLEPDYGRVITSFGALGRTNRTPRDSLDLKVSGRFSAVSSIFLFQYPSV